MKLSYAVFNIVKTAVDPSGLKFGPGSLTSGATYNLQLFDNLGAAQAKADEFARGGTAAAIFELSEARVIKQQPIEVITFAADRS